MSDGDDVDVISEHDVHDANWKSFDLRRSDIGFEQDRQRDGIGSLQQVALELLPGYARSTTASF